jgi:uncharacterized protein (DUF1697 family)
MTVYVALLRGINVGGRNSLPMQDLRDILASLNCEDVKTYIQSGNAVFRSGVDPKSLSSRITVAIEQSFGFAPSVQILSTDDFRSILAANPFPEAISEPKSLHIWFLAEVPTDPDLAALDGLKSATESFVLSSTAFFLHAPDGVGRSKLAARVDKHLGVQTTARNWRTANAVAELAEAIIGQESAR